MHNLLK